VSLELPRPQRPLLRFLGAAGTVTGSRFLVETPHARVLVDCGLFQGLKALRLRNWEPFPVDPRSIDAVLLTHAHLDHSGYLPALQRAGFQGPVYATPSTQALCEILLPDSARLQEEDAAYANRSGYSKHAPALPLYTEEDAAAALARFRPVGFDAQFEAAPRINATFRPAGHILGSASLRLEIEGTPSRSLVVSGDLGRPVHPLLRPPAPPGPADALLVESTYGDRVHSEAEAIERFAEAIQRTRARGGVVVIPAFAVDRTEVVLFHLRRLEAAHRIPTLPVYVDSPMALASLAVYRAALARCDAELRPERCGDDAVLEPHVLLEARDVAASRAIHDERGPAIIVSASGMATGGRVLHHLARRLPDPRNTIVLVGFQAEGTRGRRLASGATEVKLLGRYVPVRAEVVDVPGFSVHADADDLVAWVRSVAPPPGVVYVVHGEPAASAALRSRLSRELGLPAIVPSQDERVRLD
jgi:metallo-beta-lactamase family protein